MLLTGGGEKGILGVILKTERRRLKPLGKRRNKARACKDEAATCP